MSHRTPLQAWHEAHGGRMMDYAGWSLPVNYAPGILAEHLACRKWGALFDISHMGRFLIRGTKGAALLSRILTNDACRLQPGFSQYTFFSDEQGRPLDDAYLYQYRPEEMLLVVNAANRQKDWETLARQPGLEAELLEVTEGLSMVAVQGPKSEALLIEAGLEGLPPRGRGRAAVAHWGKLDCLTSRTGYTGEPLGFEIMMPAGEVQGLWEELVRLGAPRGVIPAGLGARDTLRLEAGLPLYGHELTPERPIFSLPQARQGVNLESKRRVFAGREALAAQAAELVSPEAAHVPRLIRKVAGLDKGMFREGSTVRSDGQAVGELTSGTMVPAWRFDGAEPGEETFIRAIGLAYLDRGLSPGDRVTIEYRGRPLQGEVVSRFTKRRGDYLKALEDFNCSCL